MKRYWKLWLCLLLAALALLGGCGAAAQEYGDAELGGEGLTVITLPPEADADAQAAQRTSAPATPKPRQTPSPTPAPETPTPAAETETPAKIDENGEYSAPEDVAEYLHLYGHLPGNFITKNEARALGWDNRDGNLWDVAPGKSIGGDRFGNYEGQLPKGSYRECDVNYSGGYRGSERIIYGADGSIWYTGDHYQSFTRLY